MRFHNGSWYYYTEEIRTGKNGIKALVLVGLRKSPGEKVASDQTSSAEAGSVRPKRLLAEAEERLRRSNEDFKSKHGERHGEQNANGDVSAEATQVFLDDESGEVTQSAGTDLTEGSEAVGDSASKGNAATDEGADVPEVSFSIEPAAVGRWVNKQQAVEPPVVRLPHGGESQLINFAKGLWAKLPSTVQSRDGRTVTLKHNLQGTEEVLFEHLTTSHDKTGRTWVDRARVKSILRITSTIENARPRFIAGNGNHIYIQRYADGFNHYVVTKPDGLVVEHGLSETLQTQWLRDAAGDAYLPAKKLDFGSPSSARSEQGGAAGTTKTSPSQSNIAPGMPGEAGPVREGAGQGDAGQGENGQQQGGSSSIESTALTEKSAGASQSSTEKGAPVNGVMEPSFSVGGAANPRPRQE